LRQAVGNLLDNAVTHSPPDTPIHLTADRSHEGQIIIEITDVGPGLPCQFLPLAFERFQRAEHARSRDTGGTGLGLSIVRTIAEAHGGSAHITNRPGGGAKATLCLPMIPPLTNDSFALRTASVVPGESRTSTPASGVVKRALSGRSPWPPRTSRDADEGEDGL
jgi:K+-sensing histidine kinase KdpD